MHYRAYFNSFYLPSYSVVALSLDGLIDGIVIPVVEHCLQAEIAARATLTCIKEHQRVDIKNVLGHERMYRAYVET